MDPTALAKRVLGHLDAGELDKARRAAQELEDWIDSGGAPPEGVNPYWPYESREEEERCKAK